MTRVNLVPVQELADQHLFAEFRELKMVPRSLSRSLGARGITAVVQRIPRDYVLGTGHVSFFYDKGAYLLYRYARIRQELSRRSYAFDQTSPLDADGVWERYPTLFNDYVPTPEALALVRQRIAERIAMKPDWYKYFGGVYGYEVACRAAQA